MIRIERIWLATEPLDMRAGTETALARVVQVFGAAQPHCAYLFTNKRANRVSDSSRALPAPSGGSVAAKCGRGERECAPANSSILEDQLQFRKGTKSKSLGFAQPKTLPAPASGSASS